MKITKKIGYCKDSKIKQSKPPQNSDVGTVQLGLSQYIFVREWIKQKGGVSPKIKTEKKD